MFVTKKTIKRSNLRLFLGSNYFTIKRYISWNMTSKRYSKTKTLIPLPYEIFTHETPLLRKLKNVDMYLQHNKVTNLKIAVPKLNGLIIKPKETFSYWKLIGKPSYNKGYLDGVVLCSDGSFKPGVGGGLCQLSNLIYWCTLHTPLKVAERHRHSHDVFPDSNRTQPFGIGATCAFNYMDLQIYNPTNEPYQLLIEISDTHLIGQWRSSLATQYKYEIFEKDHSITPNGYGGYIRNNTIYRNVYDLKGNLLFDQYITENHAFMVYNPLLN